MTREEAIIILDCERPYGNCGCGASIEEIEDALNMAIKALEQEPILDKIRADIEQITDTMGVSYNQYVSKIDALEIIDKYKAESEDMQ